MSPERWSMSPDMKTQSTSSRSRASGSRRWFAIQRSREAAQHLWGEIGRLVAGNPFTPMAALSLGHRARP